MKYHIFATVVLAAAAGSAQAQGFGFSGGEISAEAVAFGDDGAVSSTVYSGALEFSINRGFSVALDLGFYGLETLELNAETATLHAIYQLNDAVSLGAFYGRDQLDGSNATVTGIEGGTEFSGVAVEGYVAKVSGDGDDAMLLGFSGEYGFSESISALGSFSTVSLGDINTTRLAVGGQYAIAGGPELWAEIGTFNADDGTSGAEDTFLSVGARIEFGAARGTTFGRRSLFESTSGF